MKTKFKLSNRILSLVLAFVMVLGMMPMTSTTVHAAGKTYGATKFFVNLVNVVCTENDTGESWSLGSADWGLWDDSFTKVSDGEYKYTYNVAFAYGNGSQFTGSRSVTFSGVTCENDYSKTFTQSYTTTSGAVSFTYDLVITRAGSAGHVYGEWSDNGDGTHTRTCVINSTHKESASHDYDDATCSAPQTCKGCGATQGTVDAEAHGWNAATCVLPKTCKYCSLTEGDVLGHNIVTASFGKPAACSRCGATDINITVLSAAPINTDVNLPSRTIKADNSGYDDVAWSIVSAGETGATIEGTVLKATYSGTVTVRATTANATKDFDVAFRGSDLIDIGLGSVTISKKDDSTLTVSFAGFEGGSKDYMVGEPIVVKGTTTSNQIVVNSGAVATIHLDNINISGSFHNIDVKSGAEASITLIGANSLTGSNITRGCAIHVPSGAKITIDGSGSLQAVATKQCGAIGGASNESAGSIIINGGIITAKNTLTTTYAGAGIGGGMSGNGGNITINGGIITATGGSGATSIGGGYKGNGGNITINGGIVTATGGESSAGIGGGRSGGDGGVITVNGGTVIAKGGKYINSYGGAGIGSGYKGNGGTVVITGGNIKATAGTSSAEAIGKGQNGTSSGTLKDANGNDLSLQTITLNGATADTEVTATKGITYGLTDVKTLDTTKLYFYLPAESVVSSITAGEAVYDCTTDNKSFYASHDWSNGTGVCGRCGESCEHENQTGSTCEICGLALHIHNWTYTKDGNTITATCNSTGCTDTDGGSATLHVTDAYYTGGEIGVTVTGNFTNGATYKLTYNDGSETAPSSIGTHTAKLMVYENGTEKQSVTAEYKISCLNAPNPAYTISGAYEDNGTYWFKTGASVTVNAPDGYMVSKTLNGIYGSSVSFSESDNKVIYLKRTSDGALTDAINVEGIRFDHNGATGTITIENRGFWEKLLNKITFGLFFKGDAVAKVSATDVDSGWKSIQYYVANEDLIGDENFNSASAISALETTIGNNWKDYSNEIALNKNAKNVIYVKITDNVGNVTYLSSEGIVLYSDAEADTESVSTTYNAGADKDVSVKLNGNTVKEIKNGITVLTAGTDYTVSDDGTITLKADYLDTLSAGTYTFTVSYNPLGETYVEAEGNEAPKTTTFKVVIEKAEGKVSNISNISKTYDGTAVMAPTFDKLGDGAATIEYKVKGADDGTYTTTAPKNAGDYIVRVTVAETENCKGSSATAEFTIAKASAPNVTFPTVENAITYGQEIKEAKLSFYSNAYGTFNWTAPEGVPEFSGNYALDFYPNEEALQNYDWESLDGTNGMQWIESRNALCIAPAVTVNKANGSAAVSIDGWTYGEEPNDPVAASETNDPASVTYFYKEKDADDSTYTGAVPTQAGKYIVKAVFATTDHYTEVIATAEFEIAKKAVTVTANDASKTYGDSDPALTYTHTELIGSDALFITVARTSGENANTYTITASQAEGANPNYDITFKTGTFTIRKAALTVTVEDKTATYGDAVPNYTVKYEGFKNGDDQDDLGGTLAFDCVYAQFDDKGEYTIKASGYTSGNYTITYVDGKLTVNAKPITVTIQNATSIYGDALAELKATDNGIVNGDTNVYSLATTATSTSNVGKYAITGTALDSNYDVTFVNGEYEITKREITITAEAKNTIVNTALPTYTYKIEGLFGEDKLVTEPTLTCNANIAVIGEYDITATGADAGGNYSIKYVPAKLSILTDNAVDAAAGYTEELKDYDPATVTSEDKAALDEILEEINTILDDENITDNGKKALEEVKEKVEDMIKEITDAAEATDTENVGKVENVTPENVTPENKTDLEGAKADLEKALEDHGSNMTEGEKKAVEDEIKRIDEALEVIGNVEAVEELIDKLPDTIKKDDEPAIKAADDAYNALTDYEKSLVDADAKKALDDAKAALAELNKPADSTSPDTGDNSNMFLWIALLFISGGAVITLTVVDRKRRNVANK